MSEKIKAAVARMRERLAASTPWTVSEAKRYEDMRIVTEAAASTLPPEPRDSDDAALGCGAIR